MSDDAAAAAEWPELRVAMFGAWSDNEPHPDFVQQRERENALLAASVRALINRAGRGLRLRTGGGPTGCMGIVERVVVDGARERGIAAERILCGVTTRWLSAHDRPLVRGIGDLPRHIHWIEHPDERSTTFNAEPFAPPAYPHDGTRAEQLAVRQRHVIGPSPHIVLLAPGFYGTLYEAMQVLAEAVHGNYPQFHGVVAIGEQWRGVIQSLDMGRMCGRADRKFPLLVRTVRDVHDMHRVLDDVLPRVRAGEVTFPTHR